MDLAAVDQFSAGIRFDIAELDCCLDGPRVLSDGYISRGMRCRVAWTYAQRRKPSPFSPENIDEEDFLDCMKYGLKSSKKLNSSPPGRLLPMLKVDFYLRTHRPQSATYQLTYLLRISLEMSTTTHLMTTTPFTVPSSQSFITHSYPATFLVPDISKSTTQTLASSTYTSIFPNTEIFPPTRSILGCFEVKAHLLPVAPVG
ncbi:MAG: hypothetical protein Q9216_002489 [Gyalolechia sp. 2 TL-2023]